MEFELVEKVRIYSGYILDLERDRLCTTDGHIFHREVVQHRPAAAVLPLLSETEMILLRQFRYPIGRMIWEIPAGLIEEGESPLQCIERELEEEAGYRAQKLDKLIDYYPSPGFCDEIIHIFLASDLVATTRNPEPDEHMEVHKVDIDHAFDMLSNGEIIDSKTIIALMLLKRELQRG